MIDSEGHKVQFYVVQCETNESLFDLNFETTPHFDEAIDAEEYAIKMEKETGLNHWWVPVIEHEKTANNNDFSFIGMGGDFSMKGG